MRLNVRYDNEIQSIELDEKSMKELWVSLSLGENDELTQKDKEELIQQAFDEQYNRPEYNSWHKFNRHRGEVKKPFRKDDELADNSDGIEYIADNTDTENRDRQYEYEAVCQHLREVLKPAYAEVLIAVVLDGMTPEEYAHDKKLKRDAVYKRLQRAKEKYRTLK